MNKYLTEIQIVNKHITFCSTSSVIRETKQDTTSDHHIGKCKKTANIQCWHGYGKQALLIHS